MQDALRCACDRSILMQSSIVWGLTVERGSVGPGPLPRGQSATGGGAPVLLVKVVLMNSTRESLKMRVYGVPTRSVNWLLMIWMFSFVNWSTGCGVLAGTGARVTPVIVPSSLNTRVGNVLLY